jgi:hypothetical protein
LPHARIALNVFLTATGNPAPDTLGTDKMSKNRNKTRNSSEPSLLELFAITIVMLAVAGILIAGALVNGY